MGYLCKRLISKRIHVARMRGDGSYVAPKVWISRSLARLSNTFLGEKRRLNDGNMA